MTRLVAKLERPAGTPFNQTDCVHSWTRLCFAKTHRTIRTKPGRILDILDILDPLDPQIGLIRPHGLGNKRISAVKLALAIGPLLSFSWGCSARRG